MRKRGGVNTAWKRRYFLLLPDFDHGGVTLFYFVNQQVRLPRCRSVPSPYHHSTSTLQIAQKMLDFGIQTQQGYLRMRTASDLYTVRDEDKRWVGCVLRVSLQLM